MQLAILKHAIRVEQAHHTLSNSQRVMAPFDAELASWRFLRVMGIGCAPQLQVVSAAEALQLDAAKWIFKGADGKAETGAADPTNLPVLAVAKIPRAVPLSYLRKRHGVAATAPVVDHAGTPHVYDGVLWRGKDELANAAEFYSDFTPPSDWSAIREAIQWDSLAMLQIHAARLFLAATTAHASNILVDAQARLYSIDHADLARTDGGEIDLLFRNVAATSRVFRLLCPFAELTEKTMEAIFGAVADHFKDRLRRWQHHVRWLSL